jgi:hypothetical protein
MPDSIRHAVALNVVGFQIAARGERGEHGEHGAAGRRRKPHGRRQPDRTEFVVRSPADGSTLLCAVSTLAGANTPRKDLAFDLLKDVAPVGQISSAAQFLVVHASVPVWKREGIHRRRGDRECDPASRRARVHGGRRRAARRQHASGIHFVLQE